MSRPTPYYIFIVGVQKSGTTALAGWLVDNDHARYAIPGAKEPSNYLRVGMPGPIPAPQQGVALLDASTGYFGNAQVIARLPEHRTRIVVCLRNPLERMWSAYRMMKIIAQRGASSRQYLERFHSTARTPMALQDDAWYQARRDFAIQGHKRSASHIIASYYDNESEHVASGTFLQRINYERAFLLTHGRPPFFSALGFSFYYRGLRMLLEKYQPEDLLVLSSDSLKSPAALEIISKDLVRRPAGSCSIDTAFTLEDVDIHEPNPDFTAPAFDGFRQDFAYDLQQAIQLLKSRRVGLELLNLNALHRHLA